MFFLFSYERGTPVSLKYPRTSRPALRLSQHPALCTLHPGVRGVLPSWACVGWKHSDRELLMGTCSQTAFERRANNFNGCKDFVLKMAQVRAKSWLRRSYLWQIRSTASLDGCASNVTMDTLRAGGVVAVTVTDYKFNEEVSPLLPNSCHIQDYDRSMSYPAQPVMACMADGMCGGVGGRCVRWTDGSKVSRQGKNR